EHLDANAVDLLLLDFSMPVINGLDVLQAIRRSPKHAGLMVVMMTSAAEDEIVTQLLRLGVNDYLVKPLTPAILRERLSPMMSFAALQPGTTDVPGRLDIKASSHVLIVDESPQVRQCWVEPLKFCRRIDAVASATEALRRHHAQAYDIIV